MFASASSSFAQNGCEQCGLPPACRDTASDGPVRSRPAPQNCQTLAISIESDIDFGRVVLLGKGKGRVALDLATGEKRLLGNINDLGGMPITGHAVITGAPHAAVRIDLPGQVAMRDGTGGNASIRNFETTLPGLPVLDGNGRLEFRFSATLVIDHATTASGNLRGRIPITVQYP
ncbi:MAG: DUF4402 domain-containing protein [Pseudomonadota bacterium]